MLSQTKILVLLFILILSLGTRGERKVYDVSQGQ